MTHSFQIVLCSGLSAKCQKAAESALKFHQFFCPMVLLVHIFKSTPILLSHMFPECTWHFPGMITIRPEIATCILWFTQQSIDSRRLEMGSVVINGKEREGVE